MLDDYKKKRDFSRTREPKPSTTAEAGGSLHFVVQKHAARRLHYDFRLELDGVLKSWAVPKGPSLSPKEKRLAVLVEDHPLDYGPFEGVIGHGNYGAGQVIVWDAGVYSPDEGGSLSFGDREEAENRMRRDLENGKLSITLRGRKLRGSWTLVRTSRSPKDWLLIKHRDEHADAERDVLLEDRSVQSHLTMEDLKGGRLPDRAVEQTAGETYAAMDILAMGQSSRFPSRLKPMLARAADKPFSHPEWLFEPKLDGYRVLAFLRRGEVSLLSRNGIDLTAALPTIASELADQPEEEMVLDGEVVSINEDGLPDFGQLQQSMNPDRTGAGISQGTATLVYYPFDLLYAAGRNLHRVPLFQRKMLLAQVLAARDHVQLVEYVESEGESFFHGAVRLGLEGMVAKRRDSSYEPGARSRSWLKVKAVRDQEFVVGGYTRGAGARSTTFGALLVGYHDDDSLIYAGRVGSGFDQPTLRELQGRLSQLNADGCPFVHDAELDSLDCQWVRPELVARVKYAEWTQEGRLRAPVFTGLRSDIDPRTVRRETQEALIAGPISSEEATTPSRSGTDVDTGSVLEQLSNAGDKTIIDVAGHRISLTNLNKALWPASHGRAPVTKRDLIRHYVRMSPVLLAPSPAPAADFHPLPKRHPG